MSQSLRSFEEEDIAARLYRLGHINELQVQSIRDLFDLVKHGAKFIDVHVRKDAKEYHFEADWLKAALRPEILQVSEANGSSNTYGDRE